MDETDRPDDRRAAGSWVLPNSESRRQRNHEAAKSGIPKRKKTKTYPRLSCKIEYLLTSNHSDGSIASEFFTGDHQLRRPSDHQCPGRCRAMPDHSATPKNLRPLQATSTSFTIPTAISFASFAQLVLVETGLSQFAAHVSANRPLAGLPISAAISFAPLP